jgi:hypothetical protein
MYVKIFTQILDSSIATNRMLRHAFEDLLKFANIEGKILATRDAIARRAGWPLKELSPLIDCLEQPDPHSLTPDHEGRRILRLDPNLEWGWQVVNYDKYRRIASEQQRRDVDRARQQRHREKKPSHADVTPSHAGHAMQTEKKTERDSPSTKTTASSQCETMWENAFTQKKAMSGFPSGVAQSLISTCGLRDFKDWNDCFRSNCHKAPRFFRDALAEAKVRKDEVEAGTKAKPDKGYGAFLLDLFHRKTGDKYRPADYVPNGLTINVPGKKPVDARRSPG